MALTEIHDPAGTPATASKFGRADWLAICHRALLRHVDRGSATSALTLLRDGILADNRREAAIAFAAADGSGVHWAGDQVPPLALAPHRTGLERWLRGAPPVQIEGWWLLPLKRLSQGAGLLCLERRSADTVTDFEPLVECAAALIVRAALGADGIADSEAETMRTALRGTGTIVWEWDIEQDTLSDMAEVFAMLGYPPKPPEHAFTQEEWNQFVHPDDLDAYQAAIQSGEVDLYEIVYRALDVNGQWRWMHERGRIIERTADGQPQRMVGTQTDVTRQKTLEASMSEATQRLKSIASHVPGVLFQLVHSADGQSAWYSYVSDRCEAMFGVRAEALVADATNLIRLVEPDWLERMLGSIEASRAACTPWRFEFPIRRSDGERRWLLGTASPRREADGTTAWFGYMADVTDLRELEAASRAKEAAEAASQAKSEFLATMSHEIRTPMNGVLGMNELLIDSPLQPQQRAWAEAVQTSGRHLLGVINDVLDFSKIESGHLELEAVDFSLVDAVEEAVAMFAQPAEAKGLELAVAITPNDAPMRMRGDPFRLRQVLSNLLGNAIKFTEEGEVVVRVALLTEAPTDGGGEAALQISVEDTGIGIAPEACEKVFEHFSQADGSTTRQYGGTGLGLAICRRLLGLMGGHIGVESTPGVGSKFIIDLRLPLALSAPPAPTDLSALNGVRVLVVDDNQTNRHILQQQLQGWQMQVQCVEGGAAALQAMAAAAAAGQAFELALLDMHMPVMDGLQLAQHIQTEPALARTRLMMLSSTYANANADERARARAGILRYLNKPIRRADLQRAVTGVLAVSSVDAPAAAPPPPAPDTAVRKLRGRVLLVEDNPINQDVAKAMLGKLGLQCVLANHGAEAVDQVRKADFDLVLMDCQMPVMDGYQATAAIRALPGSRGSKLPIIALTANAMQGDEQVCLDAGMNAFLAKPYTLSALHALLAGWLTRRDEARAPAPAAAPTGAAAPSAASSAAINPAAIEALRELDEPGSNEFVTQLVSSFLNSAEGNLERVAAALAEGNAKAWAQAAHSLKSSAANLGAEALAGCYRELEKCGREGRIEEARSLLEPTRREQQRALLELRELMAETV